MSPGEREHGTIAMYDHSGCRCEPCRMTNATLARSRAEKARGEGNPARAAAWKDAYESGIAVELADRIIATREVPASLLHVLATGRHYGTRRGNARTGP